MKHILIAFLIALGLGLIFTSKSQVGEPYIKLNDQEPLLFDSLTSIFVKTKVEEVIAKHQFVPLFFVFDGKLFFIKSNTDRIDDSMFVGNKLGIINQKGEEILEQKYDKIYNPNFTITNCLEIAQNGKVGLLNIKTNQIIAPQFEYIVPSGNTPSNIAYGLKDNDWHEINSETMQLTPSPNYSPEKFLSELDMDILKLMNSPFYYNVNFDGIDTTAFSIAYSTFLLKSKFLELIIIKDNYNLHSIYTQETTFNNQNNIKSFDQFFGIETSQLNQLFINKFKESITLVLSFVESESTDGRGNFANKIYLLNLNKNQYNKQDLYQRDYSYVGYDTLFYSKFIDSNLLEVRRIKYDYYEEEIEDLLIKNYKIYYSHFPTYNYYKTKDNGEIDSLKSIRIFNFTKFVKINESYFKGDFYRTNEEYVKQKYEKVTEEDTLWGGESYILTRYLELDDLYIMKNEILAEYGLKFKTKYWQDFFAKFKWYKPKFVKVEKQLNARDKYNIKIIDKTIIKLQKNEWKYTKPVKATYPAVG